ncbi:hypothetical protein BX616_005297, partial [Lobosporangium transversale]
MAIGLPGFALYFISPFHLKNLDTGHWNHVNWLVMTIFLAHINSIILPLLQLYKRQLPKERPSSVQGSQNRFANIFRWDSPRTYPGASNIDTISEISSLHLDLRSPSQGIPPNLCPHFPQRSLELCGDTICDHHSVGRQSAVSQLSNNNNINTGRLRFQDEEGYPVPVAQKLAFRHQRLRGMKGFWVKYGKDIDGNMIPISQMNPRAFEYALQDAEMLNELVKFSVSVFSAENTKFLQEYDGLKKQVREYYRLAGHSSSSHNGGADPGSAIGRASKKHNRYLSDESGSIATSFGDRSMRSRKQRPSLLRTFVSSLYSRKSGHGPAVDYGRDSDMASMNESRVGSEEDQNTAATTVAEQSDDQSKPSSNTVAQYYTVPRSFGKHKQDKKMNVWGHSLQRSPNPSFLSPYGALSGGEEADETIEGPQSCPISPPFPSCRVASEKQQQQQHGYEQKVNTNEQAFQSSRAADCTTDDMDELKPGVEGGDGDGNGHGEKSSCSSRFPRGITLERPHDAARGGGVAQTAHIDIAPYRPSSLSASATFTPRLPSQPQVYGSSPLRLIPPSFRRTMSAYPVLTATAEEHNLSQESLPSPLSLKQAAVEGLHDSSNEYQQQQQPTMNSHTQTSSSSFSSSQQQQGQQQTQPLRSRAHLQEEQQSIPSTAPTSREISITNPYFSNININNNNNNSKGHTPVPRALLPAYWEICHTFIMPNATLELNLSGHYVQEIKDLFLNSEPYLEMYEPIVREVQELVYVNVWPRFVQSIQKQPHSRAEMLKGSWKSFSGKTRAEKRRIGAFHQDLDQEHDLVEVGGGEGEGEGGGGGGEGRGKGESAVVKGRRKNRGQGHADLSALNIGASTSKDKLQQPMDEFEYSPTPPQASYIRGDFGHLGGPSNEIEVIEGGGRTLLPQMPSQIVYNRGLRQVPAEMDRLNLSRYGVMQDLDLSAFERIVVDP